MAARTKAAALDEELEVETEVEATEPTAKQIINEGIVRVVEAHGIDVQKNRYKAMRAIAFQAFVEAIESGDWDDLVDRAIANVDDLPSGWEIEKPVREDAAPAPKKASAAKAAPAKTTATRKPAATKAAPAKPTTARKRPTR